MHTDAPRWSVPWFTYYLQQSRIIIALTILIFFFILVIVALAIKHPQASTPASVAAGCPAFAALIPDVISTCPANRLSIVFAASTRASVVISPDNSNSLPIAYADVANAPVAIFVPQAESRYLYTTIILGIDYYTATFGNNRNHLVGISANNRASSSIASNWVTSYSMLEPPRGGLTYRYAVLTYRHIEEANDLGVGLQGRIRFDLDVWLQRFNSYPELVAANWFAIISDPY